MKNAMQILFSTVFLLFSPFFVSAQTVISGSVNNKKGDPLSANVTVQPLGGVSIAGFAATDAKGNYSLNYKGSADSITITVAGMNIGKHTKTVSARSQKVDFVIDETPLELKEVNVTAPKIKLQGDTLDYQVEAFTDPNDRVIGDVLKKMPGIEVAPSGKISYQGKDINRFYVENLDLLKGRYGIATNNIAAKDVATVQVFENHQPIKALRDRLYSDQAAINLKLKESAKGTLAVTGLAGLGYEPWLWNLELVSMYFAKIKQNMTTYKGNNSGNDVAEEFRTHYDYERIYLNPQSPLYIQTPTTPPVAQKRYLNNHSHAITTNHLIKLGEAMELTASALYYDDRIEKEGYSRYEQYLPGDSVLLIEEKVSATGKIHNAEIALRLNSNAENHFLNNALNLSGNWNSDYGFGNTFSNTGLTGETLSQRLEKPAFSIDNTLNLIKNIKNDSYKLYFSTGYGYKPHSLTVAPVNYFEENPLSSLKQEYVSTNFVSVLRLSYGLKRENFNLNYDVWGRADLQRMDTDLGGEDATGSRISPADSLRNDLEYNTYQTGINQNYTYENGKLKTGITLPLTCFVLTIDDRISKKYSQYNKLLVNPSAFIRYDLTPEFQLSAGANFNKSCGDMNSIHTGFIMNGYRSLLRNSIDKLFESHSGSGNLSFSYRNVFEALFVNAGTNYRRSWKNLLYGYNYQGIMSIKTTIDQPTKSDSYGVAINASKGLDFWSATVRLSGGYNENTGEQLVQNKILNYRSTTYRASAGTNLNPVAFMGLNYTFSWNQNKSYAEERPERFPPIRVTSQQGQINLFPFKTLTVNISAEHQYNSAASKRYTAFADASVKFRHKKIDLELELNNLFNAKQYISASYSDISTYYYSYNLRPASALLKARFKLK